MKMKRLDRLHLPIFDFTSIFSDGKIIKLQQNKTLTSHFKVSGAYQWAAQRVLLKKCYGTIIGIQILLKDITVFHFQDTILAQQLYYMYLAKFKS